MSSMGFKVWGKMAAVASTSLLGIALTAVPAFAATGPATPATYATFNGNTDGTGSYISATDNYDFTGDFTMEANVDWNGTNGYDTFLSNPFADSNASGQQTGFSFVVNNGVPTVALRTVFSYQGTVYASSVSFVTVASNTPLVPGQWTNLAATISNATGTVTLYQNGQQVGQSDLQPYYGLYWIGGFRQFLLGREFISSGAPSYLAARAFGGGISDVRLWNSARTPSQIQTDMDTYQYPSGTPNLVAQWLLNDGSGNSAADTSGNNNPGTLNDGAAWAVTNTLGDLPEVPFGGVLPAAMVMVGGVVWARRRQLKR